MGLIDLPLAPDARAYDLCSGIEYMFSLRPGMLVQVIPRDPDERARTELEYYRVPEDLSLFRRADLHVLPVPSDPATMGYILSDMEARYGDTFWRMYAKAEANVVLRDGGRAAIWRVVEEMIERHAKALG